VAKTEFSRVFWVDNSSNWQYFSRITLFSFLK